MKKNLFLMLFGFILLISGCSEIDLSKVSDEDLERISDKAVVCNEPYIRVGIDCCLDSNTNSICDVDEKIEVNLVERIIENKSEDLFSYVKLEQEENEVNLYISSTYERSIEMDAKITSNGNDLCGIGRGIIFPEKNSVIKFENCMILERDEDIFIEINSNLWNQRIKYKIDSTEDLDPYLTLNFQDSKEYSLEEVSSSYQVKSFGYYVEKNFLLRNINTIGIVPGEIFFDIEGNENDQIYLGNIIITDKDENRLSSTYIGKNTTIITEVTKPLLPGFTYSFLVSYEILNK